MFTTRKLKNVLQEIHKTKLEEYWFSIKKIKRKIIYTVIRIKKVGYCFIEKSLKITSLGKIKKINIKINKLLWIHSQQII